MPFDKVRIRFSKVGDFRLISHHDLMRCLERTLRRAALPFRLTEGFHPMPRVVFALSLPLGVEGLNEVVEIEWTEPVEPEEALDRLRTHAPAGLAFLSAARIDLKTTARPRRAIYRFPLPEAVRFEVAARGDAMLRSPEVWVARHRPTPKRLNVRPYINDIRCEAAGLVLDIWLSQEGSARADELLRELELQPLLDEGEFVTRTDLLVLDELSADELALLPVLPNAATRAAFERPLETAGTQPELEPAAAASEWGASPNGPVVE
jgi:radical SAM-linked protein